MRIDGRFLNWGVFFILLGAIPLAVQQQVLDRDLAARAWQLWPLLIVAGGIGLVLRRTSFDFVGGLLGAATAGLILGGLFASGGDFGVFGRVCGNDAGRAFPAQQGTIGSGVVDLQFNCGDLAIGTATGSGWSLAGTSDDGTAPIVDATASRLQIRSRQTSSSFGFGTRQNWTLTVPQDPTLDLDLQMNAGSARVALAGAHLGSVSLQGNAGSTTLDLADAGSVRIVDVQMNAGSARVNLPPMSLTGTLEANAGSLALCVPAGVGLRITSNDNIISSNNFSDQGLTRTGNTWESTGFSSAPNRITLTAKANAGSITLNPKEGCR